MRLLALLFVVLVVAQAPAPTDPQLASIDALIKDGHYADAETAAGTALADVQQRSGAESVAAAHVLNRLADARLRQGKADAESEDVIARALRIEERGEPNTRELALALGNQASLVESRGDFAAARTWYERTLETMRAALGPEDRETLMAEKDLGMAWNELGEYQKARALVEHALAVRSTQDAKHVDVAILRHNLGSIYWQLGDYAAARDAFTAAADGLARALGPEHPHVASALEGLAVIQTTLGDHAQARATYRRVLAIRQKVLPPGHPLIGQTYVNLGDVLMSLGDYRAALDALNRGLAIWETALGREHPQLLPALTNLAVARDRVGDHAGARQALVRGIAIREKAQGRDDPDLIIPLTQLANLLADDGRWTDARAAYARARALGARTRGADHPYVASAEIDEGVRLAARGNTAAAAPLIEHALAARVLALGPEHPDVAAALDAHARLEATQGLTRDAIRDALDAESRARIHFQSVAAVLPEEQALLYAEARTRSQDLALFLASRAPRADSSTVARLWDTIARSRALVLEEVSWRRRLLNTRAGAGDPASLDAAANARARLAELFLRGPSADHPAAYAQELTAAREEKQRAEERLAGASAAYARDRARSITGFDDVRRSLPPGAALVAFVRYETGIFRPPRAIHRFAYAAFVLPSAGADPELVGLGSAAAIEPLIDGWRAAVRAEATAPSTGAARREAVYRDAAAALRRRIWDPLAARLAHASRVLIVPDAALHLVDFATLPVGDERYLADGGATIHYATAERDLIADPAPAGHGLLAVGDPAFGAKPELVAAMNAARLRSDCAGGPSTRFAPLAESGQEAEAVARLWRGVERDVLLLRGTRASESAVRTGAPGRRVLHLATHGFVMGEGCSPPGGSAAARTLTLNPLLAAGLVLAGASRRGDPEAGDDGILTGEEISSLDLQGVEWAVISACDSGTGGVRAGEGIFGLRRAFQIAGVRSVIVSLWPVDDLLARRWMEHLYASRVTRHRTTDEAVADADRALLSERRRQHASTHPFYWSGFVAAGDWR